MSLTPAERWRSQMEQWAIPKQLLDAVDLSPPTGPEPRLSHDAERVLATPSARLVRELAGEGGSILDIGAGSGRLAIPLATSGHRVTAVEPDESVVARLRRNAAEAGARVTAVVGLWPQVSGNAGVHDVVVVAHTVYRVQEIEAFVEAMHDAARRAVVVEMAPSHPWSRLSGYYETLHGLSRPSGPTADDFGRVVGHTLGIVPSREYWTAEDRVGFESLGELLAHYRRLLVVPPAQSVDAGALLERDVSEAPDGRLVLGAPEREAITLYWSAR